MRRAFISICLIMVSAGACRSQPATRGGGADTQAASVNVLLPAGDGTAGRQAFMDLKCAACHAVPSEPEFPAPISAHPGPPITARLANRDLSYLATAVVSPSHDLSRDSSEAVVRTFLRGALSPMGDLSRVMTVRQLVDLLAYLHSIK